jgi:hypothetical protein
MQNYLVLDGAYLSSGILAFLRSVDVSLLGEAEACCIWHARNFQRMAKPRTYHTYHGYHIYQIDENYHLTTSTTGDDQRNKTAQLPLRRFPVLFLDYQTNRLTDMVLC